MLRKALKQDFLSVLRPFLILSVSLIGLSFICGISVRDLAINGFKSIYSTLSVIGICFSIFGVCAYIIGTSLIVLFRYYQNFFTDEGYLTFTLPVKRSTLFNSKLLVALIYSTISFICVLISVIIVGVFAPAPGGEGTFIVYVIKTLLPLLPQLIGLTASWVGVYIIMGLIIAFLSGIFNFLLIYTCITLGCIIAKKYKLLAAIGVYYGVYIITGALSYVFTLVFSLGSVALLPLGESLSEPTGSLLIFMILLMVIAFLTVCIVSVYNFTLGKIKKNLNLA